ncbi:DNA-3-methyladenine glycosylase 2 family protein [Vibrio sp. JPW-9-11-11]|uniref:DNA-3-methyladenine glycosylase family protein n=1 Tax=Vibrio sp. JPW-9-11-11 TaxID=1416532 RepID=UPI001594CA03|nr:DNA-3-methyladenine glycosylase 2 family protein [Vibrio sp. JPW-9-11-11]NVD05594.1 DNA-3-methyladenine glycosylase 2 family protein [Vibrio sp. JPW-9-11-11]
MTRQHSDHIHADLLDKLIAYPVVHAMVASNGPQQVDKQPPERFLAYLSRAVAGQQLSVTAAKTIWSRVEVQADSNGLEALLVEQHYDALRKCGLSNAKVKTLLGINQALSNGTICPSIFQSDDAEFITQQLVQLWGVGQWTAEMALMFFFAHPDVWSAGDVALTRGLESLAQQQGVSGEEILQAVTPYRTYFALHVWAVLDAELMKKD